MNKFALKIAVSPLVLGLVMTGCSTDQASKGSMFRPVAATPKAASRDQQAARYFGLAQLALQQEDSAGALAHAEKAVELSPRDAGYRMLLGDLYLKSGRFQSAETTFSDVLALNPSNNRATFNLVLAEIALGKQHSALMRLDRLSETASAADLGLAFALAGQPERAVALLEAAARAPEADARVRQNLALAHALVGDWQRARVTAAQDLSPADLAGRMEQWATFVRPAAQWDQVATLLGVTPANDAGQPVRLALAPAAQGAASYAQAEPLPVPEAPVQQPVQYAALEAPVRQASYVEPAPTFIEPQPKPARGMSAPAPKPAPKKLVQEPRRTGNGRFVVQLASYDSAAALSDGWSQLRKRYALGSASPVSAVVNLPGKGKFHRLSLAGFGTQAEAARACASIKGKGGACFVRATSGDVPMQWAAR
ncbi:MAG TPA: tetratricopeptide repeat protein [Allosphingosinicella sp.]